MNLKTFSKASIYSVDDLKKVEKKYLPRHVAIIADGNRRWARSNSCSDINCGYKKGSETLQNITLAAKELGIKMLTVFFFSTENWKRDPKEVSDMFSLMFNEIKDNKENMEECGIKFKTIGDLSSLPKFIQEIVSATVDSTAKNDKILLTLALNYGSRDEIIRAVRAIAKDYREGVIDEISEDIFENYLYTAGMVDPDLIIRTSGEMRLSNFLLWQVYYSEMFFTKTLWPEFSAQDLLNSILEYQERKRRLGA